jgi:hypothetical protein
MQREAHLKLVIMMVVIILSDNNRQTFVTPLLAYINGLSRLHRVARYLHQRKECFFSYVSTGRVGSSPQCKKVICRKEVHDDKDIVAIRHAHVVGCGHEQRQVRIDGAK